MKSSKEHATISLVSENSDNLSSKHDIYKYWKSRFQHLVQTLKNKNETQSYKLGKSGNKVVSK